MDRSRKRSESSDNLPADKRACSSSSTKFRASTSAPTAPSPHSIDNTMASPPPSENYGSCRSDESDHYDSDQSNDDYMDRDSGCESKRVKFQRLATAIDVSAAAGDFSLQLTALTELCEVLSFCVEDSMAFFPLDNGVPALVGIAGAEGCPDASLLAARALTYLCDAMPRSADAIVRHGAVPVFCSRLLAIEYLDLAEQCLQALEKISKRQPVTCLQAGTIMAVLAYIDFFSTSIQRVALSTVANICKGLPLDSSHVVMESVPTLCNILQYEDLKLVETASVCLIRITECFSTSSELLDELCKQGVINQVVQLISPDGRATLDQTTQRGLIGLLTKFAAGSLLAVKTLLSLNLGSVLRGMLAASDPSQGASYSFHGDLQSNQVHEILKLLNQLIPPVASDALDIQMALAKEKILAEQPMFLHQFSLDILPTLIQLLAGLLARNDHHILASTLKIIETLLQKLSGVFTVSFIKEGVVYAIDALIVLENPSQSCAQGSSHSQSSDNVGSPCLCHAFSLQKPPSTDDKACRLRKDTVLNIAKNIKATYFPSDLVNSEVGLTEILQKLRTFCAILSDCAGSSLDDNCCAQSEEYLSNILEQVLRELHGGDNMSTFEFIESGIVKSLASYLTKGRYLQGEFDDNNIKDLVASILKRLQSFASLSLSMVGQSSEDVLLTILTRKLQNALSSLDNFPVVLSHAFKPRSSIVDIPSRRCSYYPCLKVCFVRQEGQEKLCDYDNVVSVEFSSSFMEIENFLLPKVSKSNKEREVREAVKEELTATKNCADQFDAEGKHGYIVQNSQESSSNSHEGYEQKQKPLVAVSSSNPPLHIGTADTASDLSTTGGGEVVGRISPSPSKEESNRLAYFFEGEKVDPSVTLYQAILGHQISRDPNIVIGPKFWNEVYKVTYKIEELQTSGSEMSDQLRCSSLFQSSSEVALRNPYFSHSLLLGELPCNLDKSNPSYSLLFLIRILEGLKHCAFSLLTHDRINAFAEGRVHNLDDLKVVIPRVSQSEFTSIKLTDKLEQQMRDPLVLSTGVMPLWCSQLMSVCPFLFSYETRWKYFQLTGFGLSKSQQNLMRLLHGMDIDSSIHRRTQLSSSSRKKFKVNRQSILNSAAKLMASHASSKAAIEVEFIEEVGTGLGPTMEFYTLVSHEFQKVGLGMWREDRKSFTGHLHFGSSKAVLNSAFVVAPFGLFPRPWSSGMCFSSGIEFSEVTEKFVLLGQLVAKAIKDRRILDIPFSKAFYKLMLGQELDLYDIQSFDPDLGRILVEFQALVERKKVLDPTPVDLSKSASELCFRNTRIEDLYLDFTLPGYTEYSLSPESSSRMVNTENLKEYVSLVVDATLRTGISKQLEAFKSGFNQLLPLQSLRIFTEDELEKLLCGEKETWNLNNLLEHVKFDHGYTASSPPAAILLEIIQEFESDQRRNFLQFVTGAPRLPLGGLSALNPKLTIVRKHCSNDADMDLPSVMTCANYLKLPLIHQRSS